MKILLDTNILLSAALFPNGVAAKAYWKAVSFPNKGVVCDWNIEELHKVFRRKFPNRLNCLYQFLSTAAMPFTVIATPVDEVPDEQKIRDVKDRPILRAAQVHKVDILLTGDKDFLEADIDFPEILSPTQFLEE